MFKPFRILILCLTLAGSAVSYIKMQMFLVAFDLDAIIDGGQNPFDQVIAPTATKHTFSQVENNIDWHNFGIGALLILATIGGVFFILRRDERVSTSRHSVKMPSPESTDYAAAFQAQLNAKNSGHNNDARPD
jgi:hypothetical protein